jgi:hypothetical protein
MSYAYSMEMNQVTTPDFRALCAELADALASFQRYEGPFEETAVTEMTDLILAAALEVHNAIKDDEGWAGYDPTVAGFTRLLSEIEPLVERLYVPKMLELDTVVATWFAVQNAIAEGELPVDWFSTYADCA